jgi:uncharacterized phage infection (PIP) family protein YhgE
MISMTNAVDFLFNTIVCVNQTAATMANGLANTLVNTFFSPTKTFSNNIVKIMADNATTLTLLFDNFSTLADTVSTLVNQIGTLVNTVSTMSNQNGRVHDNVANLIDCVVRLTSLVEAQDETNAILQREIQLERQMRIQDIDSLRREIESLHLEMHFELEARIEIEKKLSQLQATIHGAAADTNETYTKPSAVDNAPLQTLSSPIILGEQDDQLHTTHNLIPLTRSIFKH